jgi:Archaeal fructose-1,6-bisphosphatase and related enzymes of inositol monophosphatase family
LRVYAPIFFGFTFFLSHGHESYLISFLLFSLLLSILFIDDLSSWDIAAGALIVKEAGGRFTDLQGNDFDLRNRKICASNGLVHDDILQTLNKEGIV